MVYINDKKYPLKKPQSLSDLFISLKMDVSKGIAVALNNKVMSRSDWNKSMVNTNDNIILIKATQGG